jgi:putative FmdB family regulatory protein
VPLYDYDCANCGKRFEVLRGVHSDEPTTCALCGGGPIKKAFAAPAIHFKGSGWAKKERRATVSPGSSRSSRDDSGSDTSSGSDRSSGNDAGSEGDRSSSTSSTSVDATASAEATTSSSGGSSSTGSASNSGKDKDKGKGKTRSADAATSKD